MINEFTLKPKAQNKNALYLFITFLIGSVSAVALYIVFMKIGKYHGLVGLGAMVFIIASIFMYTRYIAAQYYYDVTVVNDTPLFIVRHKLGKRETTMCRIPLSGIVSVEPQTKAERKSHKTPSGLAVFNYCPSVSPELTYLITSRSRYDKAEITVEANEEFRRALLEAVEVAKSIYPDEYED